MEDLVRSDEITPNTHATESYLPLYGFSSLEKAEETLGLLNDYWKAKSIIYLELLGLPTLKGIAITKWNATTRTKVLEFIASQGWDAVTIRSDGKDDTGKKSPQGGHMVDLTGLDNEIRKFFSLNRIVMLHTFHLITSRVSFAPMY